MKKSNPSYKIQAQDTLNRLLKILYKHKGNYDGDIFDLADNVLSDSKGEFPFLLLKSLMIREMLIEICGSPNREYKGDYFGAKKKGTVTFREMTNEYEVVTAYDDKGYEEITTMMLPQEFAYDFKMKLDKHFRNKFIKLAETGEINNEIRFIIGRFFGLEKVKSKYKLVLYAQKFVLMTDYYGIFSHYLGIEPLTKTDFNSRFQNATVIEAIEIARIIEEEWTLKSSTAGKDELTWGETIYTNGKMLWEELNVSYCENEAREGKHCGNISGKGKLFSLREEVKPGRFKIRATFVVGQIVASKRKLMLSYLREAKGFANQKVDEKYFDDVLWFLINKVDLINYAGGYLNGNDFDPMWFDSEQENKLLLENPDLEINEIAMGKPLLSNFTHNIVRIKEYLGR